ncbi:hypothetical protein CM15mP37_07790 [bacterium]|nr:MAG: hypothetical protein CM15mP37_07790 [bacterium]
MVIFQRMTFSRKWEFRLSWHYKSTEYGGLGLDYSYGMVFAEALGYAADLGVITAIGVQTDMATPAWVGLDLTN